MPYPYPSYLLANADDATKKFEVQVYQAHQSQSKIDILLVEAPVAIVYNGISYATMLVTPVNLEDFALGFSITEGIIQNIQEFRDVEIQKTAHGWICAVEIASERLWKLKEKKRALAGRTGCGLCGVESLEQIHRIERKLPLDSSYAKIESILAGFKTMRGAQRLFEQTGACHAAAYLSADGQLLWVAEDVGRHNALDKLIGKIVRFVPVSERRLGAFLVSSRASYEMVQKTVLAEVAVLAAVSAPTALAVQEARKANLGLIGFVRDQKAIIYSAEERFVVIQ